MIKSELFQESYCIFIESRSASAFASKVRELGIRAVKVLKGTFDDNTSCIVIPNSEPIKQIETDLFTWSSENKLGGFWGQWGMGYLGKEWEVVSWFNSIILYYIYMKENPYVNSGIGLGSALAVTISWSVSHSILWAILHGIFSWFYVIYYIFTR